MLRSAILAAGGLLLVASPLLARTWHITPDGTGDAPTIQAGVDSAAAGDTVAVACGDYYEHDIVVQTALVLRSVAGEPTCVTIDAGRLGRVILVDGVDEVTIEGFTITQGLKESFGGGIYVFESSARIENYTFVENEVGPSGFGGGLAFASYASETTTPEVTHCRFLSNRSASQSGGGLAVRGTQDNIDVTISDCEFLDNTAGLGGGAYLWSCSPVVSDCVFLGNRAPPFGGGAIAQYFGSTARFDRCLIVGNEAWRGSALEFFLDDAGETIVSDCTIVANLGAYEAIRVRAGGPDGSASPDFENTVIAFHEGPSLDVSPSVTSPPQLTCCDVFGNTGGDWIDPIADQLGVRGNIGADPLFCDSDARDFHLQWGSPCLPANSGGCGLLGRYGFGGCNSVSVTSETWGKIKAAYRAKPLR